MKKEAVLDRETCAPKTFQETERRAGRKGSTIWDKKKKVPAKKSLPLKWK